MTYKYLLDENKNPSLFETMVFEKGEPMDQFMERYSTYQQAESGHDEIVEQVKSFLLKE